MADKARFVTGKLTPPGAAKRRRRPVFPKLPPALVALRKKQYAEMERNTPIFNKQYDKLLKKHRGHYVVMRDGKILGIFADYNEAVAIGERCPGGVFSLHLLDDTPIDLGIFFPCIGDIPRTGWGLTLPRICDKVKRGEQQ